MGTFIFIVLLIFFFLIMLGCATGSEGAQAMAGCLGSLGWLIILVLIAIPFLGILWFCLVGLFG